MLRGIGGNSVSELRESMPIDEYLDWHCYFHNRPEEADLSGRLELMLARIGAGFFGCEPHQLMLLTEEQRAAISNREFLRASGAK